MQQNTHTQTTLFIKKSEGSKREILKFNTSFHCRIAKRKFRMVDNDDDENNNNSNNDDGYDHDDKHDNNDNDGDDDGKKIT